MSSSEPKRRIWLVQIGEPLPTDPGPPRLLRTALLARELASRGHEVTYWSGSFSHQQKLQRSHVNARLPQPEGYDALLLYGRSYTRHISIERIRSHIDNAKSFDRAVRNEAPPDVIVCGFPLIELADRVARYATQNQVPLAFDCRDMWPDVFEDQIPVLAKPLVEPAMWQWRRMRRRAFQGATALIGISDAFVAWGLNIAGRGRGPLDRAFHLAVPPEAPAESELAAARSYWNQLLGPAKPDMITACFAGTMGKRLDLQTVVQAAVGLESDITRRIRFVLCGAGDALSELRAAARGAENIWLPGWQSAAQIRALMERSDVGLLPYPNTEDFLASYPNKVGEYLSASLPVLTGLGGVTGTMLQDRKAGLHYVAGDPASLARVFASIAMQPQTLKDMRDRALATYRDMFDPTVIYPRFADFVLELAETGSGKGRKDATVR